MGSRVSFGRRRCRCWRGGGRRCCRRATTPRRRRSATWRIETYRTRSAREGNVLLAVELVSNRGSHAAAQAGLHVEKLLALIGAVSHEVSIGKDLKDKISGRRDRAAADAPAAGRDPLLRLGNRIPGDQRAPLDPSGGFGPMAGGAVQYFVRNNRPVRPEERRDAHVLRCRALYSNFGSME